MEKDIKESRYLEHGEYDGNLYGTKIDSIHEVVDMGRTCILDVNPQVSQKPHTDCVGPSAKCFTVNFHYDAFSVQALKVLKTAEFMPFVVFIAAPELDTLRAMHKAVVDAGLTTKLLTVSSGRIFFFNASKYVMIIIITMMGLSVVITNERLFLLLI